MSNASRRTRRLELVAWLGVLSLAFALRVFGVTWGFPHSFNVDESHVVYLASQLAERFTTTGSLDPQASSYGALPLYLLAVSTAVASQVLAFLKTWLAVPFDSAPMLYVGRLISVAASVATVAFTMLLARRLFGRFVAIFSGLLLAVSVLAVREAHFGTVDSLLVALILGTLVCGERLARRGAWRDYLLVGIALALAMSIKVGAALLAAPILVAHFVSPQPFTRAGWTRVVAMGCVTIALWLLINPYVFLNPADYFSLDQNDSVQTQGLVVRGDLRPLYTLQFEGTPAYLYAVTNWLRFGLGVPLTALALAGVGYAGWRLARPQPRDERKATHFLSRVFSWLRARFPDAYLLVWLLIYFLVTSAWYAKFIRYALPLIPVLCLFAALLLIDLWQRDGRWHVTRRVLAGACASVVVAASFAYALGYVNMLRQPDTRLEAAAWIERNVPHGASILVEKDEGIFFHEAELEYDLRGYTWRIWNPYEIAGEKSVRYQAPNVSAEQTRAHLASLATTDYLILSNHWAERFEANAAKFPAQADFYQRVFSGKAGYQLVQSFQKFPQIGPFSWPDEASELTFRLFDHPAIFIFQRVEPAHTAG